MTLISIMVLKFESTKKNQLNPMTLNDFEGNENMKLQWCQDSMKTVKTLTLYCLSNRNVSCIKKFNSIASFHALFTTTQITQNMF